MKITKEVRLKLKQLLVGKTGCNLQHDGWPCGTCFFDLSEKLTETDWHVVLFIRGDYPREKLPKLPKTITPARLRRIRKLARTIWVRRRKMRI